MAIKPVGKSIIIKLVESKSESGIVLPDGVTIDKEIKAQVIAVAEDCERGLEIGHEVLLRAGAETACIPLPGEEKQLVLPETFVIAIMNYGDSKEALGVPQLGETVRDLADSMKSISEQESKDPGKD